MFSGYKVFDEVERSDSREGEYRESKFSILNRMPGRYWDRLRDLIEAWFEHLPNESAADARSRLRSNDDRTFSAAFWELYCHESLLRLNFETEVHPNVGVARRPDYLASNDATRFVLECTSAGDSDEEVAAQRRKDEFYDALNRMSTPNFFVGVTPVKEGPGSPSAARLRPLVMRWLESLDPDDVARQFEEHQGPSQLPEMTWEEQGWEVRLQAIPKRPEFRGLEDSRPIGMHGPGVGFTIDDRASIFRSVSDKATAYGQLGLPYVVAIRTQTFTGKDHPIVDALFGSEAFRIRNGPDRSPIVEPTRARDGVWIGPEGIRNRRVSAVLSGDRIGPIEVVENVPTLWHNPSAEYPVTISDSPWRQAFVNEETGELRFIEPLIGLRAFFSLSAEWPGAESPFRS